MGGTKGFKMAGGIYGTGGGNPDPRVADVDPNRGIWSTIKQDAGSLKDKVVWAANNPKEVGMWLVDNGLYDTQKSWYSVDNLINIATLGGSVIAGAFSAGTGTAAVLGARMALGAIVKGSSRIALKETVEDFAVKPALKGAIKNGVVEPIVTAPVIGGFGAGLKKVNDALEGKNTTEAPPLSDEEFEAELDGLSKFYQKQITPKNEALPQDDVAAEQPATDSVKKAFMDTFNSVAGIVGAFVPKQAVALLAGVSAAFVIATAGDGDENTSKMEELSSLPALFMEAALGAETKDTPAPTYTMEQKGAAPSPAAFG